MEDLFNLFLEHREFIYVIILSIFLGIEVISNVPAILHTPLMSGANAIHGVVIIGAIIVMGHAEPDNTLALVLGFLAVSGNRETGGVFHGISRCTEAVQRGAGLIHQICGAGLGGNQT